MANWTARSISCVHAIRCTLKAMQPSGTEGVWCGGDVLPGCSPDCCASAQARFKRASSACVAAHARPLSRAPARPRAWRVLSTRRRAPTHAVVGSQSEAYSERALEALPLLDDQVLRTQAPRCPALELLQEGRRCRRLLTRERGGLGQERDVLLCKLADVEFAKVKE